MTQEQRAVTVAVDNDFPVVIAGLRAVLADHAHRVRVVDLHESEAGEARPDIVLKDAFALAEDVGHYVARAVSRVVLFAASTDPAAVDLALAGGAAGYVYKGVSVDRLVDALVRVGAGEQVVEVDDHSVVDAYDGTWPGEEEGLSERESEVLGLICQGLSNQEVATNLYLSINSVKTYIRTLYRKIGADSRSQAVIWGIENGFRPGGGRHEDARR